jgi:hypothetical protein
MRCGMRTARLPTLAAMIEFLRAACCACLALAALPSPAQLVVHHLEQGAISVSAAGDTEWVDSRAGRALRNGDRVWTDPKVRAEFTHGPHDLRVPGRARLSVIAAAPGNTHLSLRQGSVVAHVGALAAGENFEIDTPNMALRASRPGIYRIDVDPRAATTAVTVLEGAGLAFGERGQSRELAPRQRVVFSGRALAARVTAPSDPDGLERWAQARERAGAMAPAFVARDAAAMPVVARPTIEPAPRVARDKVAPRAVVRPQAPSAPAQKSRTERWQREQEDWLRYQHGLPPLSR